MKECTNISLRVQSCFDVLKLTSKSFYLQATILHSNVLGQTFGKDSNCFDRFHEPRQRNEKNNNNTEMFSVFDLNRPSAETSHLETR